MSQIRPILLLSVALRTETYPSSLGFPQRSFKLFKIFMYILKHFNGGFHDSQMPMNNSLDKSFWFVLSKNRT